MSKVPGVSVLLDFTSVNFVTVLLERDDFVTQVEVGEDELLRAIKEGKLKYIEIGDELFLAASKEWLGNVGSPHEISRRS